MATDGLVTTQGNGRDILWRILKRHLRQTRSWLAAQAGVSPSTITRFLGSPERGTKPRTTHLLAESVLRIDRVLAAERVDDRLREDFRRAALGPALVGHLVAGAAAPDPVLDRQKSERQAEEPAANGPETPPTSADLFEQARMLEVQGLWGAADEKDQAASDLCERGGRNGARSRSTAP